MKRFLVLGMLGVVTVLSFSPAAAAAPQAAASEHTPETEPSTLGELLPIWSSIPFIGMLLSIALMPLALPSFWHHHYGKVSMFWSASLGIPFVIAFRGAALHELVHIILADYIPFIILLWSLYTVSGGILLRGSLRGTPPGVPPSALL